MMRMINGRYRIVREIYDSGENLKSFLVLDLWNDDTPVCMTLFDSNNVPDGVFDFLKENLLQISALNTEFYLKNIGFSNVISVDNQKKEKKLFLYTSEFLEWKVPLMEYVQGQDLSTILKIVVQICQAGNFCLITELQSFTTSVEDFFIEVDSSGEIHLKIRDFFTIELNRAFFNMYNYDYSSNYNFINPINLGKLFLQLFDGYSDSRETWENIDLIKTIYSVKKLDKSECDIFDCLINIIEKLILDKYTGIKNLFYDIFFDINNSLNTSYIPHSSETDNVICDRPKLVAFNDDIEKLVYKARFCDNCARTFIIKGNVGSGKTRFLKEVAIRLSLESLQVFEFDMTEKKGFFFWLSFFNLLFRYESRLNDDYDLNILLRDLRNLNTSDEDFEIKKYKLLFIFTSVIESAVMENPVTIIIDNFDSADDFTLDVFFSLAMNPLLSSRLILIFSVGSLISTKNQKILNFEKEIPHSENSQVINLKPLNEIELAIFLKNFLLIDSSPLLLSKAVHRITDGNPLFSIFVIKDLIKNKALTKDNKSETWLIIDSIFDMALLYDSSRSILEFADEKFKFIDYRNNFLLQLLSVFNSFFKKEFLYDILNKYTVQDIDNEFDFIFESGYIQHIYDDVYRISDYIFKTWIYEAISEKKKQKFHKRILDVLLYDGSIESINEAVFHLEFLNMRVEAVLLYCRLARYNFNNCDYQKATYNYEKAFALLDDSDVDLRFEILLDMGLGHFNIGNVNQALLFWDKCKDLIDQITFSDLLIKYYLVLADIANKMGDNKKFKFLLDKIKKNKYKISRKDYKLKYKILIAVDLINSDETKQYITILNEVINECSKDENLIKIKIYALRILGNAYLFLNKIELALENYQESYNIAETINSVNDMLYVLNNLAYVHTKNYGDYKKSLFYYDKIIDISKDKLLYLTETHALLNKTQIYLFIGDLKKAQKIGYKVFADIITNTIDSDHKLAFIIFLLYVLECKKKNYVAAKKYYDKLVLIEKEKKLTKLNSRNCFEFYLVVATSRTDFGDYSGERSFIKKAQGYLYDSDNSGKTIVLFRLELNEMMSFRKKSFNKLISMLNETKQVVTKHDKNIIISSSFSLIGKFIISNQFNYIKDFAEALLEFCTDDFNDSVTNRVYINLIKSYIDESNAEVYLLEALHDLNVYDDFYLEIIVNIKLGLYYIKNNNVGVGVLNFLEAQNLILKIISNIFDKDKLDFFNSNSCKVSFALVSQFLKHGKIKVYDSLFGEKVSEVGLKKLLQSRDSHLLRKNKKFVNLVLKDCMDSDKWQYKNLYNTTAGFTLDIVSNIKNMLNLMKVKLLASNAILVICDYYKDYKLLFADDNSDSMINTELLMYLNKNGIKNLSVLGDKIGVKFMTLPLIQNQIYRKRDSVYLFFVINKSCFMLGKYGFAFCKKQKPIMVFLLDIYLRHNLRFIDSSTGAISNKYFDEYIDDIFSYAESQHESISIVFCSIDNIKMIRKQYGRESVNSVLKKIVSITKEVLNANQSVCHYGDEDFIIVFTGIGEKRAFNKVKEIKKNISQFMLSDIPFQFTITTGLSSYPKDAKSSEKVIAKAIAACEFAKATSNDTCVIWNDTFKRMNDIDNIIYKKANQFAPDRMSVLLELLSSSIDGYESIDIMLNEFMQLLVEIFDVNNIVLIYGSDYGQCISETKINLNSDIICTAIKQKYISKIEKTKKGFYEIDWENNVYSEIGVPKWTSVLVSPIVYKNEIKGIIYLDADAKTKRFQSSDLVYLSTLAMIIAKEL